VVLADSELWPVATLERPVVFARNALVPVVTAIEGRAMGFGEGNFRALFEAIEREQALRGNL